MVPFTPANNNNNNEGLNHARTPGSQTTTTTTTTSSTTDTYGRKNGACESPEQGFGPTSAWEKDNANNKRTTIIAATMGTGRNVVPPTVVAQRANTPVVSGQLSRQVANRDLSVFYCYRVIGRTTLNEHNNNNDESKEQQQQQRQQQGSKHARSVSLTTINIPSSLHNLQLDKEANQQQTRGVSVRAAGTMRDGAVETTTTTTTTKAVTREASIVRDHPFVPRFHQKRGTPTKLQANAIVQISATKQGTNCNYSFNPAGFRTAFGTKNASTTTTTQSATTTVFRHILLQGGQSNAQRHSSLDSNNGTSTYTTSKAAAAAAAAAAAVLVSPQGQQETTRTTTASAHPPSTLLDDNNDNNATRTRTATTEPMLFCWDRGQPWTDAQRGPLIIEPHEHDVLLGRGRRINGHVGNLQFRSLCWNFRDIYHESHRGAKSEIAFEVLNLVRNRDPPGRFLVEAFRDGDKKDQIGWEAVPDKVALEKICQTLRERKMKTQPKLTQPLGSLAIACIRRKLKQSIQLDPDAAA